MMSAKRKHQNYLEYIPSRTEKADPLYERLICYMKILHNNGFIH